MKIWIRQGSRPRGGTGATPECDSKGGESWGHLPPDHALPPPAPGSAGPFKAQPCGESRGPAPAARARPRGPPPPHARPRPRAPPPPRPPRPAPAGPRAGWVGARAGGGGGGALAAGGPAGRGAGSGLGRRAHSFPLSQASSRGYQSYFYASRIFQVSTCAVAPSPCRARALKTFTRLFIAGVYFYSTPELEPSGSARLSGRRSGVNPGSPAT